ncbi:transposase family protein [Streptomyces sp. NPDC102409]|uniref:helix-turn-helix domain-containing protein n=1 Tax=Streptomyces sp. NPDC102409 TaxID=3366172 RepID=UPI00381B96FC
MVSGDVGPAGSSGRSWWGCKRVGWSCRSVGVAGLSTAVIADRAAELGPVWQARRDAELLETAAAGGRSGRDVQAGLVDRLLATLVHLRHGVTHDVLACWFQVDRSTITRAVGEIRPLLADRGCRTEGGCDFTRLPM